jgi:NADH dehydrogenase, FAD-containing subunit
MDHRGRQGARLLSDRRTVLVLGGGVGGIAAANRLRKLLSPQHRVVLIDRERDAVFQPSLLWVAAGDRTPEAIQRPLAELVRKGVELRIGTVEKFDAASRTVRVAGEDFVGDAVILALGADLAPEMIPGLAEAGHNLYTLSGAMAFRDRLAALTGGRVVVLTASPAYKCPAAPYEMAMLAAAALRRGGDPGPRANRLLCG